MAGSMRRLAAGGRFAARALFLVEEKIDDEKHGRRHAQDPCNQIFAHGPFLD
jgi:hypothetical protein